MFSNQIRALRKEKKATQNDVALSIGVATSTYSMYEQGLRQPDFETMVKIADYFNVSVDSLLGIESINEMKREVYELFSRITDPEKRKAALEVLKSFAKE